MSLVDYSSSEDEQGEEATGNSQPESSKLPSLPAAFHDLYSGKSLFRKGNLMRKLIRGREMIHLCMKGEFEDNHMQRDNGQPMRISNVTY